jgi:hypothetical protein
MFSPCSPGSAPTILGSSERECGPLPSASPTPGAEPCSPSTGPECPASTMSERSQGAMFPDLWISSPEDSRARTSRRPGGVKGSEGNDLACGSSTCGWCRSCDPFGWSLRTFLSCVLADSTTWLLVWKKTATPSGRWWWALGRSGRRTGESESGLSRDWATPTAHDQRGADPSSAQRRNLSREVAEWPTPATHMTGWNQGGGAGRVGPKRPQLQGAVLQEWPTPRTAAHGGERMLRGNPTLLGAARDWPTPTVNGNYNRKGCSPTSQDVLDTAVRGAGQPDGERNSSSGRPPGLLNPDWVEQLQGLPRGWTSLDEDVSFRIWLAARCASLACMNRLRARLASALSGTQIRRTSRKPSGDGS